MRLQFIVSDEHPPVVLIYSHIHKNALRSKSHGRKARDAGRARGVLSDIPRLVPALPNTYDAESTGSFVQLFGRRYSYFRKRCDSRGGGGALI